MVSNQLLVLVAERFGPPWPNAVSPQDLRGAQTDQHICSPNTQGIRIRVHGLGV